MSRARRFPTELSTPSVSNCRGMVACTRVCAAAPLLALLIVLAGGAGPAHSKETPLRPAAAFLKFEPVLDGKCHILSEGGKLVLLHNTHPTRAIVYRLERRFVKLPQGLMDGTIGPGAEPQKLGCDTVGGRPQTWQVKRAEFAPERSE